VLVRSIIMTMPARSAPVVARSELRKLLGKLLSTDSYLTSLFTAHFPDARSRFMDGVDRTAKVHCLLLAILEDRQVQVRQEYDNHSSEALITV